AEVPELDSPLGNQCVDDGVKGALDNVLGLELSQTDILGDLLDNLFLGHDRGLHGRGRRSVRCIDCLTCIVGLDYCQFKTPPSAPFVSKSSPDLVMSLRPREGRPARQSARRDHGPFVATCGKRPFAWAW